MHHLNIKTMHDNPAIIRVAGLKFLTQIVSSHKVMAIWL